MTTPWFLTSKCAESCVPPAFFPFDAVRSVTAVPSLNATAVWLAYELVDYSADVDLPSCPGAAVSPASYSSKLRGVRRLRGDAL